VEFDFGFSIVDFLPVYSDGRRGVDAQSDSVPLDRNDHDPNVAVNHDFFANSPCEYQHVHSSVRCHGFSGVESEQKERISWSIVGQSGTSDRQTVEKQKKPRLAHDNGPAELS